MLVVGSYGREYKSFLNHSCSLSVNLKFFKIMNLKLPILGSSHPLHLVACCPVPALEVHSCFLSTAVLFSEPLSCRLSLPWSQMQSRSAPRASQNNNVCVAWPPTVFPPSSQHVVAHIVEEGQHLQDSDILQVSLWVMDTNQNARGKRQVSTKFVAISQEPSGSFTARIILGSLNKMCRRQHLGCPSGSVS